MGGSGLRLRDAGVVVEELGHAGVVSPVVVSNVVAAALAACGSRGVSHLRWLASGRARYTTVRPGADGPALPAGGMFVTPNTVRGTLAAVPFGRWADFVLAPLLLETEPALALLPVGAASHVERGPGGQPHEVNVEFEALALRDCTIVSRGAAAERLADWVEALAGALSMLGSLTVAGRDTGAVESARSALHHAIEALEEHRAGDGGLGIAHAALAVARTVVG
jgi:hypothetical protein